jgi:hypothetical protein
VSIVLGARPWSVQICSHTAACPCRASTGVDTTDPPVNCQSPANPGVREVGWIDSGGGFSHVFAKPSYQDTLPAGSTAIGAMRGVPDVAYQASSRTGVLVYDTAPGDASSGLICPNGDPCSAGAVAEEGKAPGRSVAGCCCSAFSCDGGQGPYVASPLAAG